MGQLSTPSIPEAPAGLSRLLARAGKMTTQTFDGMRALRRSFAEQYAYGHREVLLEYASISRTAHLAGGIQHGVWHGPGLQIFPLRDRWGRKPKYWVWNNELAREARLSGARAVLSIGSPWAYMCHALESRTIQAASRQRIRPYSFAVFPGHSTDSEFDESSPNSYSRQAKVYRDFIGPGPSVACLYWTDYFNQSFREAFLEEGFEVTTAGLGVGSFTPWSPVGGRVQFLSTLYSILTNAEHFVGDTWSTSAAYAASLGLRVSLLPDAAAGRILRLGPQPVRFLESSSYEVRATQELRNEFPGLVGDPQGTRELRPFARDILGFGDVLEPGELREVLDYRVGVVPDTNQRPW